MAFANCIRVAAAVFLFALAAQVQALTLGLALVLDGSSSISGPNGNQMGPDWGLQIGAYESIFSNQFFTNLVEPSPFDNIVVGAFVFSGGIEIQIVDGNGNVIRTEAPSVFSTIDWTLIENDQDAANFGGQFANLPQPGGTTATADALTIATQGGTAGCANPGFCNLQEQNVTGLLNNGFTLDRLVIDISTDGVPTEPNGNGTPNDPDRDLAIAAADSARQSGVIVNALGVGDLDAAFLTALVGIDPAKSPVGFFETAADFSEFEATLLTKLGREILVPIPATLPLFLSGLAGWGVWRRRQQRARA